MVRVTINNASTPGTFFDNIHNDNLFINEYYLEDIDQFDKVIKYIPKNAKVYVEDNIDFIPKVNNELYSSLRYDYINEKTIESFRTKELDELFNNNFNDRFKLSKTQYKNYKKFVNDHHDCRVDENGLSKFGTIGGGTSFNYALNYCAEEMFPNFAFLGVKCHGCNKLSTLSEDCEELTEQELKDFEAHKKYGPELTRIAFYRFMAIYNEFKGPLELSIMGTGLGDLVSVKVKDFIFDITDNSHW